MALYTKRPDEIEAVQWRGNNVQEIIDFCPHSVDIRVNRDLQYKDFVLYLNGTNVPLDYFIIKLYEEGGYIFSYMEPWIFRGQYQLVKKEDYDDSFNLND